MTQPPYEFDLSGGVLCLDFANTVSRRNVPAHSVDHLVNYDDLIAFAEQSKLLSSGQLEELQAEARRHSREARESMQRATALREEIYRAFSALAGGKLAASSDISHINDSALEALQHRHLVRDDEHYRWEWKWNGKARLDCIQWLVALSAAELLTSSSLAGVRLCEAPDCAWLFLDQSRNRSRRWCDMKVCGNRQKARRHYQRTHP